MSKRAANFTRKEEAVLISLVKKYAHILDNKKTDATTNKKKKEIWQRLTNEFNAGNFSRDTYSLKGKYDNIKKRQKSKNADQKIHSMGTRGEPTFISGLDNDDMEDDLCILMGPQITAQEINSDDDLCIKQCITPKAVDNEVEETSSSIASKTAMVKQQVTSPLKTGVKRKWNSTRDSISKWATMKTEVASLQEIQVSENMKQQKEEHTLKLEMMREKHEQQLKHTEEIHALKIMHLNELHAKELNK